MPLIASRGGGSASAFGGLRTFASAAAYESIATYLGDNTLNTFTLSGIPQTYKHLQVRITCRTGNHPYDTDDALFLYANSDTGSNYSTTYIYGSGGSVYSGASATQPYYSCGSFPSTNTTANAQGVMIIDILDYTNTNKYKTLQAYSGFDTNTANSMYFYRTGNWRSTVAISSLKFLLVTDTTTRFDSNSSVALYGIK